MPTGVFPRKSVEERFWSKINKKGPYSKKCRSYCWEWTAGKDGDGYGNFSINRRSIRAHRYSYKLYYGNLIEGMLVCHKCDNPSCVNPKHLFTGTALDNKLDSIRKGRDSRGDRHFSITNPEKLARGDSHGLRKCPEKAARGDRHGSKTHPERLARGNRSGRFTCPERNARGERINTAKLTEAKVKYIRKQILTSKTIIRLAIRFGVNCQSIRNVVRRITWAHLK